MTAWVGSILLSQDQIACVKALVVSSVGMTVIITVDQPAIQITSVWNGDNFDTQIVGEEHVSGYAVSIGIDEISYLLNYVADVDAFSTVTIDGQVKEASISLVGG